MRSRPLLVGVLFAGLVSACAPSGTCEPSGVPAHAASGSATELAGVWLTESGNFEIRIAPCAQALCGTVVKVLANRAMSNSNTELKSADGRPLLGLKILSDFTPAGDGEWKGDIYNRENGKTYSCVLSLASADQLKVHSYIGLRLFGKTQIWQRVSAATEK